MITSIRFVYADNGILTCGMEDEDGTTVRVDWTTDGWVITGRIDKGGNISQPPALIGVDIDSAVQKMKETAVSISYVNPARNN